MGLKPLKRSQLAAHETLFSVVEGVMGFMPDSMLIMGRSPELLYSVSMLSSTILKQKPKASKLTMLKLGLQHLARIARMNRRPTSAIPADLRWLVASTTSSSAGCHYCQGHTAFSAHRAGVAMEKLKALDRFETSDQFTDAEKAALRLAWQGGTALQAPPDEAFEDLEQHFDEQAILEIVSIIALFGFLNKWNLIMNTQLEDVPATFCRKFLNAES